MKDKRILFWVVVALYAMFTLWSVKKPACAEQIRDLATIQGVRSNALIGYGLVAGLDGTGDQTTQTPFTRQSLANMLSQLGVTVPPGTNMQLRNIAAVMVTAQLPPYARPGQKIDVVVSSLGNAKSLRGGTLIMSPLKGADGQVYALAQGNVLVGGAGVSANRSRAQINQLAVGSISGGATVERMVETPANNGDTLSLELNDTDFGTARRVVDALNSRFGAGTAQAVDARAITVRAPADASARVDFIARIQEVDVNPAQPRAKVVLNSRTGSIVMNQAVALRSVAVAHGNLSVRVDTQPVVSQPSSFGGGETVVAEQSEVSLRQDGGKMQMVQGAASLADVVKALNALGATPADLMSILQAMKSADALRADLEII